jgi:retron-type reverse transcriptase
VTKSQYEHDLEANLAALHRRIQGGGWKPRPSREVLIPKPQGGFRPLAIGCLEDKIVQTLVARILEAIYDPQFHRHSYGFREGKSAHQAVGRLYSVINERRRNCVVEEMDIEKFFNSMDQAWVMQRLEEQIADPHFLRLVRRLLRGAVLHENGQLAETERGTPQGSPVSPILANICLHFLLDEWFVQNYSDKAEFVRYADDAVFVFKNEDDARQFQAALADRLKKPTKQLWRTAASKLRGHFAYFGVCYNQPRLNHFYQACISALFKWLNRRSQKRSTTWERFALSLHRLLPAPPTGNELKDLTSELSSQRKHQPKSRMRETRTSGSVRSARLAVARPVFT